MNVLVFGAEERSRSRTQQHFREQVNINHIMKVARRTGILPVKAGQPLFGDFTGCIDYHDSMNKIVEIDQTFGKLPSEIRKRFKNDPGALLEFLNKDENYKEACELGLTEWPSKERQIELGWIKQEISAPAEPDAQPPSGGE